MVAAREIWRVHGEHVLIHGGTVYVKFLPGRLDVPHEQDRNRDQCVTNPQATGIVPTVL